MPKTSKTPSIIQPINGYLLLRKDDDKKSTKGGILLPDAAKVPVITCRVMEIAHDVSCNPDFNAIRQYCRVLIKLDDIVPVELTTENNLYVVPAKNVVAVFTNPDPGDQVPTE